MSTRHTPLRGLLLAALALLFGSAAQAQLLRESPFKSRTSAPAGEAAKLPWEFCGYIQTADGLRFRVREPEGKRAAFVQLNVPEPELGLVARRHDATGEMLVVEYEGRTLSLPQQISKVRPAAAAMPPPRPPFVVPPTVPSAPRAIVPGRVLSSEEVRAEIIRRQQERAAAEKNQAAKSVTRE